MTQEQRTRFELRTIGDARHALGIVTTVALLMPTWLDYAEWSLITATVLGAAGLVGDAMLERRMDRLLKDDIEALRRSLGSSQG